MVKRRRRQIQHFQSKQVGELAYALAQAQAAMSNVGKNATNDFLKTKFADLASVRDMCLGALNAHDIAVTQTFEPADAQGFHTTKVRKDKGGQSRVFDVEIQILGVMRTQITHKSGQWMASVLRLPANWGDPHNVGGTITYFRRYMLAAMSGVAQFDDDGESAKNRTQVKAEVRKPEPKPEPKPAPARRALPSPAPEPAPPANAPKRPVTGLELEAYALSSATDPYLMGWIRGTFIPRDFPMDVAKWTEAQVEKAWPNIRDHLQKCKAIALAKDPKSVAASAAVPALNGVH